MQWRLCEIGLEDYSFVLLSRYAFYFDLTFTLLASLFYDFGGQNLQKPVFAFGKANPFSIPYDGAHI